MSNLTYERKNAYEIMDASEIEAMNVFCETYKTFLDEGKTEKFAVRYAVKEAKKYGYLPFEYGKTYKPGDRIYLTRRDKAVIFAQIGTEPLENGFQLIAAHADNPRLDIKANPLYEDSSLVYFKTHYYGGILKYQWLAIPLALYGSVYLRDGREVEIRIGEDENDPVFCISDLLPHLGKDIQTKNVSSAFPAENLNILCGSTPDTTADANKTKEAVLKLLNQKYGITESDLLTAELSAVPAGKARDLGFDRSMILAFGHDDRSSCWPAFRALLDTPACKKTCLVAFADKEEIGSVGITGMRSNFLTDLMTDLCESAGQNPRKALANTAAVSADVSAAFDPNYAEVFEKRNTAYVNSGVCICKFTGARGKSGSSEADGGFIASLCAKFDLDGVLYQFGELGKVDQGGGGTVAQYLADKNIEVVDIGIPMLSMHAPYEIAGKADVYMLYKLCKSFFKE